MKSIVLPILILALSVGSAEAKSKKKSLPKAKAKVVHVEKPLLLPEVANALDAYASAGGKVTMVQQGRCVIFKVSLGHSTLSIANTACVGAHYYTSAPEPFSRIETTLDAQHAASTLDKLTASLTSPVAILQN